MGTAQIGESVVDEILRLASEGKTNTEIADEIGCSRDTVRRHKMKLEGNGEKIREKELKERAKKAQEKQEKKEETPEEKADRLRMLAQERELLRDVGGEKSFRSFLERLYEKNVDRLPPPPKFKPATKNNEDVKETLVAIWSDWHYAEIVKKEAVQGLNEYNRSIAAARVYSLVQKIISIKSKMGRGGWRFPRLVIAANGDMVSGSIHDVEKSSDPNNIILASYECARLLALAIRDLAAHFEEILVVGTSGNHGRLPDNRHVPQKEPTRNWDTSIYLMSMIALENVDNVSFVIPDSYMAVTEIEGHLFGQSHGHDIRGWMHTPIYGFNRMVSSLNSIRVNQGNPINYFIFGHFHNKISVDYAGAEYFCNGSLIGGTEYSVNTLGKADKPCQWLLGVHEDHGVTHRWPLYPNVKDGAYEVKAII